MTKEIRDNMSGETHDADDSWEFTFLKRDSTRGLIKIEGDVSEEGFLKLYAQMVKKPPYQKWVKHDDEEKEATGKTGHWEKLITAEARTK